MVLRRLLRPSRRGLLGSFAAMNLGFRTIGELPVGRFTEGLVVPATISIASRQLPFAALGLVATAGLYLVAMYAVAPRLYRVDEVVAEDRQLNLLFAAGGGIYAMVLLAAPNASTSLPVRLVAVFGVLVVAFFSYFQRRGWISDPDAPLVPLADRITTLPDEAMDYRREFRSRLEEGGWYGTATAVAPGVVIAVLFAGVCLLLGAMAAGLSFAYPLPELLVLGWVGYGVAAHRLPAVPVRSGWTRRGLDLEESFYRVAGQATRGPRGFAAVFLIAIGVIFTGFLLPAGVGFLAAIPSVLGQTGDVVALWVFVGIGVTLVTSGGFGLWFWVRMSRRLAAYLDHFDRSAADTGTEPLPTRPVGLLVPAALGLLGIAAVGWTSGMDPRRQLRAFAVFWPAYVLIVATSVGLTRRLAPQSAASDRWAIPTAVMINYLSWAAILIQLVDRGYRPLFALIAAILVILPAFTELEDLFDRWQPLNGYGQGLALTSMGLLLIIVLSSLDLPSEFSPIIPLAWAAAGVLAVGGLLGIVFHWYDRAIVQTSDEPEGRSR